MLNLPSKPSIDLHGSNANWWLSLIVGNVYIFERGITLNITLKYLL